MARGAETALPIQLDVIAHQAPQVVARLTGGETGLGELIAPFRDTRQLHGIAAQPLFMGT